MTINVTWLQDGGYTAAQDRTEQCAIVAKNAVVTVRPGIIPSDDTDAAVTALGSPGMFVDVAAFQAVIPDANGRAYLFTSDSQQVPAFLASSGANPRIDLVIARVYDNAAGDSAATGSLTLPGSAGSITVQTVTGTVEVVEGTPNASPSAPALPNSRCIILAVVTVRRSTTSIVSGDIALSGGGASVVGFTCAAGGLLRCRTSAEYPATPYEGMQVYDMSLNYVLTWNGSAWCPPNGEIASASFNTDLVSSTTTEVVGYSQAIPIISGRRYRVYVEAMVNAATAGNLAGLRVRTSTGTVINTSTLLGNAQKFYSAQAGGAGRTSFRFAAEFTAGATTTTNIALGVLTLAGTGNTTIVGSDTPTIITVDQIG